MTPFPRDLRIGTKLAVMVLAMMAVTLTISFIAYDHYARIVVTAVQTQTEALSKALEISVQQLTSKGETDQQILQDYVRRLSARGVTEISILSSERKVVASSNRAKVGTTVNQGKPLPAPRGVRKGGVNPLVVTGTIGDDDDSDHKKVSYSLDIPIIINDKVRGYVRLRMILDDFTALLQSIYLRRALATSFVFLAGVLVSLFLAYRMTSPLNQLASAADRVAAGDLGVEVRVGRRDEIGRLQRHFNHMVEQLRESRRLESALRRAERAGVVGRLASAVAHEIRNPLNYVNLTVDHLRAAFRPAEADRALAFDESLTHIKEELRRLDHLVSEFLAFGRPPRLSLEPCRVGEVLDDVARLAAVRAGGQGVRVEVSVAPLLPVIRADPEGLRTCLLNLVTNALQAMPQGGRLALAAAPAPGGFVLATVSDEGEGIPEAHLDRLFEPYFSTKEEGTGLGLAITRRIVEDHGGRIEVASRVGRGAEFSVLLPVAGPDGVAAEPVGAGLAPRGHA